MTAVVPFHEFLAKSRAASCFSESLGESSGDSFAIDVETGFGCWDKGYELGAFGVVVKIVGGQIVGVYVHLGGPGKKMNISIVILPDGF